MQCSNPFLTFFINYNNAYLYDLYDNFVIYKYYVYVYCTYTMCVLKKHRVFIARSNDYFFIFFLPNEMHKYYTRQHSCARWNTDSNYNY